MIEELLQMSLEVKRDVLPVHEPFSDRFGDLWLVSWAFWFFPLGLSGFLRFQEAESSLSRAYKSVIGAAKDKRS